MSATAVDFDAIAEAISPAQLAAAIGAKKVQGDDYRCPQPGHSHEDKNPSLSINRRDLPLNISPGQTTFRSITIDGEELEFSDGFTDLHTQSYQQILAGNGFSLDDVRPSVETVSFIRSADVDPSKGEQHPFLGGVLDDSRYRNGFPI